MIAYFRRTAFFVFMFNGQSRVKKMSLARYLIFLIFGSLVFLLLGYIGPARANVLDGGEIRFSGVVTDESPKWTWQIGSPEQFWTVDIADAQAERGYLVFDLSDRGVLPFLEGHLQEVAERGGPGFTPFITFTSGGQPVSVIDGGSTSAQRFRASVPVRDPEHGSLVGQLFFTLDQGLAISAGHQEEGAALPVGMSLVSGQSVTGVQPDRLPLGIVDRLSVLLSMNNGFGGGMSTSRRGQVLGQEVLADRRAMNLAAAYASALSAFELRLPAEGTPSRWQAGLTVTVTVQ